MINPNALTYGVVPSAPASLKPVDIETWKATISPTFKNYFLEEYNDIVRQYESLVRKYEINKMVYESHIGVEPIIGHIYHLYQRSNGNRFLSLIGPEHTSWNHMGSYRLSAQFSWEEV